MIKLLEDTANEGLTLAKDILARGEHMLGNMWTGQLTQPAAEDLNTLNAILPGLVAQFRTATASEVALLPQLVDHELLEGTTVNFSRSLIRLAWLLQHAETILPGRRNPSRLLESATLMPGDSCCRPVHGSARSRTIRLSLSGTLDSADLSMAAGNLAVLRLVVSLTDPLASSSSSGTQMPRSMA